MDRKRAGGQRLGSTTARSLSLLYVGQLFNILITVGSFVVLTRMLGPGTYGLFVFAFGFSGLLSASGNFGIASWFGKNLSKYAYNKDAKGITRTIASGYGVLLVMAVILTLVAVILSGYAATVLFTSVGITTTSLVLASLTIFFLMVQNSTVGGLIGFSKPFEAALTTILIDIVQLVLIVTLLLAGYGLNGAIVAMLIGYVVGTIVAVAYMFKAARAFSGFRARLPSWQEFCEAFNFAAPLGANSVLNVATQNFSILFLGFFVSTTILGNYGVALKGISLMAVLYSTMSNVLVPTFAAAEAAGKKKHLQQTYNKIMLYSLTLTLPLIIYVGVLARPEITLFFSASYAAAPLYLTLIAFGTAISMIGYFLGSLIAARGLTRKFLLYNFAATIIELVALVALTPTFTVVGSIVAIFLIGNVATDLFLIKLAKDELKAHLEYWKMAKITVVNLVLAIPLAAALLLGSSVLELIAGIIILAAVYPAMLGLLKLVESKDLRMLVEYSARIRIFGGIMAWFCAYTQRFLPHEGVSHGS